MKELFEYLKKREASGKLVMGPDGKPFYGQTRFIFNAGKPVHTEDWTVGDIALIISSRKE